MRAAKYLVISGCMTIAACADFQPAKTAHVGGYELQLKTDPTPLMVGKNAAVSFSIRDGVNQPVANCKVHFRQYMPGHEMPLDKVNVIMIDEAKVGDYDVRSGEFKMGGEWVLEFNFICGADHHTQSFDFHLEWPE